jgi:hypothetical protein
MDRARFEPYFETMDTFGIPGTQTTGADVREESSIALQIRALGGADIRAVLHLDRGHGRLPCPSAHG